MKVTVPQEVMDSINGMKANKTAKAKALQVYTALTMRNSRADKHGYFAVPSKYLLKISRNYSNIMKMFIADGIVEYYKRERPDPVDPLFNTITTKYYNKKLGICMKYRFKVDITTGKEMDVNMVPGRDMRWYTIVKQSLTELGYENRIGRDSFGRRVHHPAILNYKTELKGKGLCVIDAKCSQPKLLYNIMKRREIVDANYFEAFEKYQDFYSYVVEKLNLDGSITEEGERADAKDVFMYWVNSNGYIPQWKNMTALFPEASKFIKTIKFRDYKNSSAYLQQAESKIWIDDLLNNIPCEFALPVHDSFIVKAKDANTVLQYCKDKYSEIDFVKSNL